MARDPAAVEVGPAVADQVADDRQRLLESADLVVGRVAEGLVLRVVPATPDAEDEPAAADVVERRGHLGQQGRVAERRAHDDRPELDALRRLGDGRQDRPALVDAGRLAIEPEEQMVEDPDRVEPRRLGGSGDVADLAVGRRRGRAVLLADGQDDPDARALLGHRASSSFDGWWAKPTALVRSVA